MPYFEIPEDRALARLMERHLIRNHPFLWPYGAETTHSKWCNDWIISGYEDDEDDDGWAYDGHQESEEEEDEEEEDEGYYDEEYEDEEDAGDADDEKEEESDDDDRWEPQTIPVLRENREYVQLHCFGVRFVSAEDGTDDCESYESLRDRAQEQGRRMREAFERQRVAITQRRPDIARRCKSAAHGFKAERDKLNAAASDLAYKAYNAHPSTSRVDLHGQHVHEAIRITDRAIAAAAVANERILRIVVGKGLHSPGMDSRLKPAVEKHLKIWGFDVRVDSKNTGALIVTL